MTDSKSALERFVTAVVAGEDVQTEAAALALSAADAPALMRLAQSDDADARWWSVRALAHAGGPDALPVVVAALQDGDPSLRAAAALALGHMGARMPDAIAPALPALTDRLADDDGFVRQAAVDGLSLCGPAALPALAEVLFRSTHQGARSRAAAALRGMRSSAAAPLLFRFLNDPNHLVHTYCYEALDDLGLLETMLVVP